MTPEEIAALSDEDFADLQTNVNSETTRRTLLARIPAQVTELTTQYVASGGSMSDITDAVSAG